MILGRHAFLPGAIHQLGVGQDPSDVPLPKRLGTCLAPVGLRLINIGLPGEHSARLRWPDAHRHRVSAGRPRAALVFGVDVPPVIPTGAIHQASACSASSLAVACQVVLNLAWLGHSASSTREPEIATRTCDNSSSSWSVHSIGVADHGWAARGFGSPLRSGATGTSCAAFLSSQVFRAPASIRNSSGRGPDRYDSARPVQLMRACKEWVT